MPALGSILSLQDVCKLLDNLSPLEDPSGLVSNEDFRDNGFTPSDIVPLRQKMATATTAIINGFENLDYEIIAPDASSPMFAFVPVEIVRMPAGLAHDDILSGRTLVSILSQVPPMVFKVSSNTAPSSDSSILPDDTLVFDSVYICPRYGSAPVATCGADTISFTCLFRDVPSRLIVSNRGACSKMFSIVQRTRDLFAAALSAPTAQVPPAESQLDTSSRAWPSGCHWSPVGQC